MTILIGILCEDGVVIGSDSSATFTQGQLKTIEQPTKKVFNIGEDLIFAGTGSVGLMQRFREVLANKKSSFKNSTPMNLARELSAVFIKDMLETHLKPGLFGALVAFYQSQEFHLIEYEISNFQPEFKTSDTWFCSMGSGQPIADPFLGFIRRVLFDGKKPTLNEGVFATHWTLKHAIELNTGGINGPAQIATLSKTADKKAIKAKLLSLDTDLSEHNGFVDGIEGCIKKYRSSLVTGTGAPPIPQQPQPPPAAVT
jgi:20S proteasome alpha/beta subunit